MWALFICVFWMAIHRHFPGNMSSFLCLVYLDSAPHISFGGFVGLVWEAVRNLLAVLYVCHSAANLSCLMMKGQTDSLACVRVTFSRPVCHKTATAVERRGGGLHFFTAGFSCQHLILVWKSIDWAWQLHELKRWLCVPQINQTLQPASVFQREESDAAIGIEVRKDCELCKNDMRNETSILSFVWLT